MNSFSYQTNKNIKNELHNIFNDMRFHNPTSSNELFPIKFDGGEFYYTENGLALNGRRVVIISNDGMHLEVDLPYLDCNLDYLASYKNNRIFEAACKKYKLKKIKSLLANVENAIDEVTKTNDEEENKVK